MHTTDKFLINGTPKPGVPFLCAADMTPITVPNEFLVYMAIANARVSSKLTLRAYADTLHQFFEFLATSRLTWNDHDIPAINLSGLTAFELYGIHLSQDQKITYAKSTIRKKLTHVMMFYRWALSTSKIDKVPWTETSQVGKRGDDSRSSFARTQSRIDIYRDNVRPRVPPVPPEVLSISQCQEVLRFCGTETLKLTSRVILATGLRNAEVRSLPRSYIFQPDKVDSQLIGLHLSPDQMSLKNSKYRVVYLPAALMQDLFDYCYFGEGAERARKFRFKYGRSPFCVFLNSDGMSWHERGLNNSFRRLWSSKHGPSKLDFRVTPHLLRHTYATHELQRISKVRGMPFALAWVRDRLGHSSILTTMIYIHCMDLLAEADFAAHQESIDAAIIYISAESSGGQSENGVSDG